MRPRDLLYIGALLGTGFWLVESWLDSRLIGADSAAGGSTTAWGVELSLRTLVSVLFFAWGALAYLITKKMHRNTERLRKIFDTSSIGIHEMDLAGEVTTANSAACRMLGLGRVAMGRSCSYLEAIDPRDRDRVAAILRGASRDETARFTFRSTQGYTARTFESSLATLPTPDGKAERLVVLTEDITAGSDARNSLKRFEHIVMTSRDLIAFVDREGTFLVANQALADHMGVDRELLGGKRIDEVGWRMDFGPQLDKYLARCLAGEDVSLQQWTKGERGERFVDLKMSPHREDGEGVVGVVISARDITESKVAADEQKKLEGQVLQAQKLESLGVMAGGIAHDFNNMLTGILGQSTLMLQELPVGSAPRTKAMAIERDALRAAELCKQMLAYAGEEKPDVRPACLNSILSEMSELLEASISKKAILHCGLADDLPESEVDATQIRQIVMNLVTNGSEALGDEPGDIRVSTGVEICDRDYLMDSYWCSDPEPGMYVFIEVSDTGCGMDDETLRTLLDPFFTTKFAGRGVGMAAVLGIVKSHAGALRITSKEGAGTTVRVLIPALSKPEEESLDRLTMDNVWQASGTVLVVDDEMSVQEVARDSLHLAGLSVLSARDGQEALRIYREHADEIIAVILDQSMPVMSGDETFRALRKMNPHVRVVLSSGFTQQDVADELMEQGLAGFVQKPYGPGDLLSKLREILN